MKSSKYYKSLNTIKAAKGLRVRSTDCYLIFWLLILTQKLYLTYILGQSFGVLVSLQGKERIDDKIQRWSKVSLLANILVCNIWFSDSTTDTPVDFLVFLVCSLVCDTTLTGNNWMSKPGMPKWNGADRRSWHQVVVLVGPSLAAMALV